MSLVVHLIPFFSSKTLKVFISARLGGTSTWTIDQHPWPFTVPDLSWLFLTVWGTVRNGHGNGKVRSRTVRDVERSRTRRNFRAVTQLLFGTNSGKRSRFKNGGITVNSWLTNTVKGCCLTFLRPFTVFYSQDRFVKKFNPR